ncbi:MAG: colanic acid/amylovoran biosynthesis glycosyltransferase [Chlamydiales bacterium]|jgi:colanic acid/amylovoran biosynthesis glycosyltransferase
MTPPPHRIAYLLKKFPRLSETFVLNEILHQEALGQDIHIFSRRSVDDEPTHEQLASLRATIETLPGTHTLNPWGELFVESGAAVPMENLAALVRSMKSFQGVRMGRLVAEAIYLHRRVRELGIGHVHVHFATDSAIVAMMLRALGGPPYSITAHAKDIYRTTINPLLLGRIIADSEFTVTVCDANVQHLNSILAPDASAKLRRLYNGIDLESFRPSGVTRDENHILAVGRLVPKKGFPVLLQALAQLRAKGSDCRATIVGDGTDREALEQLTGELGLTEHVTFTGPQTQARVREHLERATVFCLPCVIDSDGNRDALPTVLLEALAVGIPVVSTPVTGIPEILDDGKAGLIVTAGDARATASALERLLASAEERSALVTAGRQHVQERFDARSVAKTLGSWLTPPTPVAN